MGIRINTNVSSLNTQRHLYNSTINFNKSMEKLASGLRINCASDDAAVRETMATLAPSAGPRGPRRGRIAERWGRMPV